MWDVPAWSLVRKSSSGEMEVAAIARAVEPARRGAQVEFRVLNGDHGEVRRES